MFKQQFPVLLYGIRSKSVRKAGRLIMVLAAIHNFIIKYSTPREAALTVIALFYDETFVSCSIFSLSSTETKVKKRKKETKPKI